MKIVALVLMLACIGFSTPSFAWGNKYKCRVTVVYNGKAGSAEVKAKSMDECWADGKVAACYNRCEGVVFNDCDKSECRAQGSFEYEWVKEL